jgi:hypothetical protein
VQQGIFDVEEGSDEVEEGIVEVEKGRPKPCFCSSVAMIYTHVLNKGGRGVRSPIAALGS